MPGIVRAAGPITGPVQHVPQHASPTVRLAVISEGIISWPLYVAQSKRLFEHTGIHVELTHTGCALLLCKLLADQGLRGGDYAFKEIGCQETDVEPGRGCDYEHARRIRCLYPVGARQARQDSQGIRRQGAVKRGQTVSGPDADRLAQQLGVAKS